MPGGAHLDNLRATPGGERQHPPAGLGLDHRSRQSPPGRRGFNAYLGNRIEMRNADGQEIVQEGRAFHSIYFEVLGEHGWIGLAIFFAIFAVFFLDMRRIRRKVRDRPDLEWLGDLARALSHGVLIFMAGAAFVGIAFYPLHYYLFALAVSASAALHRAAAAPASAPALPVAPPQAAAYHRTWPVGASGRGGHPDIARLSRFHRMIDASAARISDYLAQPAHRQAVPYHLPAARWQHVARDVEPASRRIMPVHASRRDRPADAVISGGAIGAAAILDVGPGRVFHTPSAAAAAARQGDVIRIAPGLYEDCAVWRADGLIIEGEDAERVVIGNRTCLGKGVFVIAGNDVTVRGVTLRGARSKTPTAPAFAARARNSPSNACVSWTTRMASC